MELSAVQLRVVSCLLTFVPVTLQSLGPQEYCWPRAFNATCSKSQVIIMKSAKYGRMSKGDCVSSDDHVGCYADVLPHVDRKCSGRHHCQIDIPDDDLHKLQPCPKDMFSYLEADYTCEEVETGAGHGCGYSGGLTLEGASGYMASVVTEELGHGSHRCPWIISLQPGQRINITLLDFGVAARYTETGNMCHVYAKIKERSMASDVTICGSLNRQKSVYISETNRIEVQIMSFKMEREPVYFALKYDAIGCTDPVAPSGAWLKRTGEKAVITCNFTSQAWHIVCHGNEWFGQIENCTIPHLVPQKDPLQDPKESFPYGLLVAVVTGVVLGVVIGIAMLSLVLACHKRRKRRRAATTAEATYGTHLGPREGENYIETPKSFVTDTGYSSGNYGYTHVCGLRAMYQYNQDQLASKDCLDRPDIQPDVHTCTHDYEGFGRASVNATLKPGDRGATVLYRTYDPSREAEYETGTNKYGTTNT